MDIIFDIGNVICEWNPHRLVRKIFATKDEHKEALASIIEHHDWLKLDKGIISLDQAITKAGKRCSLDPDKIAALYYNTPASLLPIAKMIHIIRELAGTGNRLFVLSNMPEHSWHYLRTEYDFWSNFSGIVVSYQIHLLKPDAMIFEHLINQYDLVPRKAIFLDDMYSNIEAAAQIGFNTIHVQDTEHSINELYRFLAVKTSGINNKDGC